MCCSVLLLIPKRITQTSFLWGGLCATRSLWLLHLLPSLAKCPPPFAPNILATGKPLASHGWSCCSYSLDTLVVGDPHGFNVTLTVRNEGEDSYRTQVTFYYPSGLSYRKVLKAQVAKPSQAPSDLCFLHLHGWWLMVPLLLLLPSRTSYHRGPGAWAVTLAPPPKDVGL